jgi:hypothetical protein
MEKIDIWKNSTLRHVTGPDFKEFLIAIHITRLQTYNLVLTAIKNLQTNQTTTHYAIQTDTESSNINLPIN